MKKLFSSKKKLFIVIGILLLLCSSILIVLYIINKPEVKKKKKKSSQEKIVQEEIKKVSIINEDSNERPMAVMIDNNVGNNSHYGINEAYITYECIVEGGLTRIMAIFKDKKVDKIGPVRSSRHYFLDYSLEEDSIYTHFGWSPQAENDMKTLGVNNINGLYDNAFWRDYNIAAPHNAFTSTDKIKEDANRKGYRLESNNWKLLNYSVDEINLYNIESNTPLKKGVEVANTISMNFSGYQTRGYQYNNETKTYIRLMNGQNHIDAATNNPLTYKNIIIVRANNYSIDSYGRQNVETSGTHEAYYITNGYSVPINAIKNNRGEKTKYEYKDGEEIKVNDGNTFIEILPSNNLLSIG